jgi:putative hydrolase
MIDLHTHSIFSDGELIPSELARRAVAIGYTAIAITDHGDHSNIEFVIPRLVKVCKKISDVWPIKILPGIELTHVPPVYISELAREARSLGARIIVVHGETIVEPVLSGTNLAALEADVNILAHPGLITEDLVQIAAKKSVFLEITTRQGHSYTNGHVASLARKYGAALVLNTDSHSPKDLITEEMARRVALGAGLRNEEIDRMFENSDKLVKSID